MVGSLLTRGLLVGLLAGILAFGFAKLVGEPQVDIAIAFESKMAQMHHEEPEPVLVSRGVQSSWGLLTGVVVYSTALGGIFALVFAFLLGRVGAIGPRGLAALLALVAFVAVVLVPALKYPPNPPSVGQPDTIGYRTEFFFVMLAASVASMGFAVAIARNLVVPLGRWNAWIAGAAAFVVLVLIVTFLLPDINEGAGELPCRGVVALPHGRLRSADRDLDGDRLGLRLAHRAVAFVRARLTDVRRARGFRDIPSVDAEGGCRSARRCRRSPEDLDEAAGSLGRLEEVAIFSRAGRRRRSARSESKSCCSPATTA